MSASYLGISACFFDQQQRRPYHAFLNMTLLQHPHTGENLSLCLEQCLQNWGIPSEKILLVVSDNGANMVKAIRLLREREAEKADSAEESDTSEGSDNQGSDEAALSDNEDSDNPLESQERFLEAAEKIRFRRLPCMVHVLQLVVREAYKHPCFEPALAKARHLVGQIRKSSVMMEKLVAKCGKSVIADCTTRWNSTYAMARRLIDLRTAVNEVVTGNGIDTLLASEWAKLEEIATVLEPFSIHTDVLQTDALSLSQIVPCLMDLQCHLNQIQQCKPVTAVSLSIDQ